MKKLITFLVAVLLCSISFAKIWRVNNVFGIAADYTTVQAAHDNILTLDGDTLHLEASAAHYGNLILTKRLTIISLGDFLSFTPNLQYSPLSGRINALTISNASASNSVFHCNFASTASISNANNLRFERCRMEGATTFNLSNSNVILGCYTYYLTFTNSNGNLISNNIISYFLTVNSTAAATIVNNVLYAEITTTNSAIQNSTFQNNIINKNGTFVFTNSTVSNNLASNTNLPAGNGNVNSVNMANVFVNPSGTNDAAFILQTVIANPAIGAGANGFDCGAYGGLSPFKPGLQPAVPAIYKIVAPASPSGATMNVTFSTRSNN